MMKAAVVEVNASIRGGRECISDLKAKQTYFEVRNFKEYS